MLLTKVLDGYWLEKKRNVSPHTKRDYDLTFRRLCDFVGIDAHIEHINTGVIRAFLNHLADEFELSAKSQSNAWTALSSLWTWAAVELDIPHAIRGRVKRPQYRRPQIETYTQTEVQAMLNSLDYAAPWLSPHGREIRESRPTAIRDRAILITLVDTGLRASELCALKLVNYNDKSGQLSIKQGKGKKDRLVYASESARKAIWRYLATRPEIKPTDPLFATRTNTHLDRYALGNLITGAARRAGVAKATVHRFRHTFAVNFLRNGGNVVALQELLGHERLETIRIYVKLAAVDLENEQAKASVADAWRLR